MAPRHPVVGPTAARLHGRQLLPQPRRSVAFARAAAAAAATPKHVRRARQHLALAPAVLPEPQVVVPQVVKVYRTVPSLDDRPDAPVNVGGERKQVGLGPQRVQLLGG